MGADHLATHAGLQGGVALPGGGARLVLPLNCWLDAGCGQTVAVNQEPGDRPTAGTGEDQAEGGGGNADLQGIGDPLLGGELRRPGDRGAVAPDQRHRAHQQTGGGWQATPARQGDAQEVLGQHQHHRQNQQHHQGAAATAEVPEAGIQAHSGEEVDEQQIAGPHAEADLKPKAEMQQGDQQGHQQAATDRFGNGVLPQQADTIVEGFANEKDENSQRHR